MEKVAFILGTMGKLPMQKWGRPLQVEEAQRKDPEGCAGDGKAPNVA